MCQKLCNIPLQKLFVWCMLFVSDESVKFSICDARGCIDHVKGKFHDLQSPPHNSVEI